MYATVVFFTPFFQFSENSFLPGLLVQTPNFSNSVAYHKKIHWYLFILSQESIHLL